MGVKDLLLLPHTLAVVIAVPKSKKNESYNNNNNNKNDNNKEGNKDDNSADHITLLALSTTIVHEDSIFMCVPVMSLSTFTR